MSTIAGTPENDIKQKVIDNFSQSAQSFKTKIENASNDLYRISDGNINLATRDLSHPGSSILEAAGRYASQGASSEENYFYTQSKQMDKIISVTSAIVGDYDQNKAARKYDHVDFTNNNVQSLMSYNGYGSSAQNYANQLLSSSSTIYNVTGASGASGQTSFQASGQGMRISSSERAQIARTGQFTRNVNGNTYTYSVASYQGQAMTNAQVQSAVLNANAEKTHQESVIGRQGQSHKIAAYNKIKNDTIANFNKNLKSEGITFTTGTRRECDKALRNIVDKRQEILNNAMGNPAFASLRNDISRLTAQLNDPTIDAATKKNLRETLNKKNSQIREIGDFQKRLDNLDAHITHIQTYRDQFATRSKKQVSHNSANSALMGARIIGKSLIGDDMQQGIDFYKKGYQVARTSVKIVAKSAALAGTGAEIVGHAGANFGLKLIDKHSTGKVNETVNSLIKVNDKAHDGVKSMKQERKARREADRSGLGRDYRQERRTSQRNARVERRTTRKNTIEKEVADLRSKTGRLSKEESRRLRAGERKLRGTGRREWLAKKFDWVSAVRDRFKALKEGVGKILGAIASPFKSIAAPFQFINKIKMLILKYAVIALGAVVGIYVLISGVLVIIAMLIRFVSAIAETSITGALDNINYCQIIVNDVCENLSPQMESTCKKDAEKYYLTDAGGKVKHEIYDWYKDVNEGEIRYIKDETLQDEIPALTSNLLPIVSMMHYRFEDEINFNNWYNARAYVYYMFVTSHNIAGYAYREENDCDPNNLYLNGAYANYNTDSGELLRPIGENCSNVYVHGYSSEYSIELNKLRSSADQFLSVAIAKLNESLPDNVKLKNEVSETSGAFTNEKPHDAVSTCESNTYKAFQKGREDYNSDVCPGYTHTHGEQCYKDCSESEHTHSWGSDCYNPDGSVKCTKSEHTHSDSCKELDCGKSEHSHVAWVDENSPGCYNTLYVCQGHCGGHVTPQVDIIQEMRFENLANMDTFKSTYFLTEVDFAIANVSSNSVWYRDLNSWRKHWMSCFQAWFVPFPKTPWSAITYAYGKILYASAEYIDTMKNFLFGTITGIDFGDEIEACDDDPETSEDIYGFEGWFNEDETLNESIINELKSFYGVYEDNYKDGYQNWEDIGEVVFPVGNIKPLTASQIADILSQMEAAYPSLSESRWKVIEEALSKVGKYSYDLSAIGHNNGIYGESGRSECSGFVSGVLYRALGDSQYTSGWSASTFAANGHSYSTPTPGDVLAHSNGGEGYTGHVIIYLGYLSEGIDGYSSEACPLPIGAPEGYYVIECTNGSGINGSCIRQVDIDRLPGRYPSAYTACY